MKSLAYRVQALEYLVELLKGRGGSPSIGIPTTVLWDPALPSSGNRVQTFDEVENAIALSQAPIQVVSAVSSIDPVRISGVRDLNFARLQALYSDPGFAGVFPLAEGAAFTKLGGIENGAQIIGHSVTPGNDAIRFDWTARPDPLIHINGGLFNAGTEPMIQVPTAKALILVMAAGFAQIGSNDPLFGGPIVNLTGTASVTTYAQAVAFGSIGDGWCKGDAPSTLDYESDGTLPSPLPVTTPGTGFNGTIFVDVEQNSGGSGPTGVRPFPYYGNTGRFNEDTGKPMFWNPILAQWVYADGSPA